MRQALEMALEALETAWYHVGTFCPTDEAIELYDEARAAIKEALAQPEQKPLCTAAMFDDAFLAKSGLSPVTKLYTTPPQRTWVGLTDEEIKKIAKKHRWHESNVEPHLIPIYRGLEAKLKEKNA